MRLKLTVAVLMTASALSPCFAQTAVGVGTGVANSRSDSKANAVAIGGGNGTGGNSAATVNIAGTPANTTSTINNTGTQTIKNVPAVFAPGLAAAGLETCLGSVSGGGAFVGTGFSFGTTIPDPGCAARLDARTLWSMGLKKAAIARLCLGTDMYNAMPDVCAVYLPRAQPVYAPGPVPAAYTGGPIMLVEGATGREHLCTNYDEPRQRCRVWADAVVRGHYAANKKRLRHSDPVNSVASSAASQEDRSK